MNADGLSLTGRSILITRSTDQAEATAMEIRNRGGTPLLLPCLEITCLPENIIRATPLLKDQDTEVLFTSRNGVTCVASVLGSDFTTIIGNHRVTAIGSKTAQALNHHGVQSEQLSHDASQEGLIKAYQERGIPEKLLFFRAEEGNDLLSQSLNSQGCDLTTLFPYRMNCPEADASETVTKIHSHEVDAVLLGSPKTVENYIKRIGNIKTADIPAVAVISPQVAAAAEDAGLSVQAVAKTASFEAMLDALADYFLKSGA